MSESASTQSQTNNKTKPDESTKSEKSTTPSTQTLVPTKFHDGNLLELVQYKYPQIKKSEKSYDSTLPSSVTIPVGLAQVIIGLAMIICGSLAFRHRSYLCYYGSGLWTGMISGITGALLVTSTKREFLRLNWFLRGGKKWKIHFIVSSAILALSASVLMSLFSMSSMMHEADHSFKNGTEAPTQDDLIFENRQSSSAAINAFLLVLAVMEILLSFCTIGITLRVLCRSMGTSSILFPNEPENRLLKWIGNHINHSHSPKPIRSISGSNQSQSQASIVSIKPIRRTKVKNQLPQIMPTMQMPMSMPYPIQPSILPEISYGYYYGYGYQYPAMIPYPIAVPMPISACPSCIVEEIEPCPVHCCSKSDIGSRKSENGTLKSSLKSSSKKSQSKTKLTEENISETYSALDRAVAKSFSAKSKINF